MKTILRITLLSAIVIASPVHAGTLDTSILDLKVGMPFENARKWVNERIPNAKTRMADQAQGSDGKQFFTYLQLTTSGTTSKGIEKLKADNGFIGETRRCMGAGLPREHRLSGLRGPCVTMMARGLTSRK